VKQPTIFALATAPGRAAVAVIRLSGPGSANLIRSLTGRAPPPARRAALRRLADPASGRVLDEALVLWFPAPGSYTGDDCAELQLHGGSAVVEAVTGALLAQGAILAEPGAFTRRAFENGRLDLSQAEAVADLVDAETEAQRRQALAQLDGDLARRHAAWRLALVEALAVLEAAVDFPDEDLPETVASEAQPLIARVTAELDEALADEERGERIREGYRVALIGAPNAGKSSLLNALAGRPAAIVTATPGTTRDVIEVPVTLSGYRVLLADTAGVRTAGDAIEAEGVRRARDWAASAALRLMVMDAAEDGPAWRKAGDLARPGDFCVSNKQDLAADTFAGEAWAKARGLEVFPVSVLTGAGLEALRGALTRRVVMDLSGADFPAATRARHRRDLEDAKGHLQRATAALAQGADVELAAEDVRLAARSLARVGGRVDPEDVLDRVFARFCIGK
jgi:tRNA modification GTPase